MLWTQVSPMQCRDCHSFGAIDADYIKEQAAVMMEKLEGEEDIDFSIIAIDDESQCEDAVAALPVDDREDFLDTCQNTETSVSFRSQGQEFIVIKADKAFLSEDAAALRGLLAHELMHTVQRDQELEEKIEDGAKRYEDEMLQHLQDTDLSEEQMNRFLHTVFQTAIYTLKDLFTNATLIEQGFQEELQAYYRHMLGIDSFCPVPDVYGEEADVEAVQDAVTFELGLLPAWLPFEALDPDASTAIRERISECYEEEFPQLTEYVEEVAAMYEESYDDTDAFVDAFFGQVVEHAIDLMETAPQQSP